MSICSGETTDPEQLAAVGDPRNAEAWDAFELRYDPMIRRYIRPFGFDAETNQDLKQRIWIDLLQRMRVYQHAPHHRFRAWLKRLCQSRAINDWRRVHQNKLPLMLMTDEQMADQPAQPDPEFSLDEFSKLLFQQAEVVQESVRLRVDERSWKIFCRMVLEEISIRCAASEFHVSYASAFATRKRIMKMLRRTALEMGFIEAEGHADGN